MTGLGSHLLKVLQNRILDEDHYFFVHPWPNHTPFSLLCFYLGSQTHIWVNQIKSTFEIKMCGSYQSSVWFSDLDNLGWPVSNSHSPVRYHLNVAAVTQICAPCSLAHPNLKITSEILHSKCPREHTTTLLPAGIKEGAFLLPVITKHHYMCVCISGKAAGWTLVHLSSP